MLKSNNIAGLILAAGLSRRYGEKNKLLFKFDGETMIRKVAKCALNSFLARTIVVTGHENKLIEKELMSENLEIVYNASYIEGMGSSIRYGISAICEPMDGVLIILGDMPDVKEQTINELCLALSECSDKDICIPTYKGKRGNPKLFGNRYFSSLKKSFGDQGGKAIIEANLNRVRFLETCDEGVLNDYDHPVEHFKEGL